MQCDNAYEHCDQPESGLCLHDLSPFTLSRLIWVGVTVTAVTPRQEREVAVELIEHACQEAAEIVVAERVPVLRSNTPILGYVVADAGAGLEAEGTIAVGVQTRHSTRLHHLLLVGVE